MTKGVAHCITRDILRHGNQAGQQTNKMIYDQETDDVNYEANARYDYINEAFGGQIDPEQEAYYAALDDGFNGTQEEFVAGFKKGQEIVTVAVRDWHGKMVEVTMSRTCLEATQYRGDWKPFMGREVGVMADEEVPF